MDLTNLEERICKNKTKIMLTLLPIITILIISSIFIFSILPKKPSPSPSYLQLHHQTHLQVAHSTCQGTLYQNLCLSTLSSFPNLSNKTLTQIISATVKVAISDLHAASSGLQKERALKLKQIYLNENSSIDDDCHNLIDDTVVELNDIASDLFESRNKASKRHYQTMLSAAMTNLGTCLDEGHVTSDTIQNVFVNVTHHLSNSLAMVKKIVGGASETTGRFGSGDDVLPEYRLLRNGFPAWLSGSDRKLLLRLAPNETTADLVVATDGSGNFTTVGEAVAAAPTNTSDGCRFVIYIKEGAYFENVKVDKNKTNLVFVGDGIGKTVIKASRSKTDGFSILESATLAVFGRGFIAKGITIENASGPTKYQAVALRTSSDHSAFYQCSFVSYHNTLFVHRFRQFYRECDVYGTVEFIFGNAATVLQNCNLYARKPNSTEVSNIFVAQGRDDPNQSTGISVLNSKVVAGEDLIGEESEYKTYLGSPWKEYSRAVFMKTYIGDLVDPEGYVEWNGTFGLDTVYFGEYENRGPGSDTSGRVSWPGFRVIDNETEAEQFTVANFIHGNEWLNESGIPYSPDLS